MRRRLALVPLVMTALAMSAASATPAVAADPPAQVSVVHGLRGLVADISVDGKTALQGFGAERSTDPLPIPAGSHKVEVRRSGDSGPPVISTTADFASGTNVSVVVHVDPAGKPVLTPFVNNAAATAAGSGRLAVRNTAAWPAAQFVVDGAALGGSLASGQAAGNDLPAGDHTVTVQAPDSGQVLLGAQSVQVPAGATTALYLIGSPKDGSLGWLVQTISLTSATPGGVPTGNSGLKAAAEQRAAGRDLAPGLLIVVVGGAAAAGLRRRLR